MNQLIKNHVKNIRGWKTKRKLVIFCVDDYGNVRIDSPGSRQILSDSAIEFKNRYDTYDSMETRADLEALYEVLGSVKDKHGNPALFTAYTLPCNIDFEAMAADDYTSYRYELLPRTFEKLGLKYPDKYAGAWTLWQEGIENRMLKPQFHGREHFNLYIFDDLLKDRNKNLITVLQNNSYVTIPEHSSYNMGWTSSYAFNRIEETLDFLDNIRKGLQAFSDIFGFQSDSFTPPAQQFPLHLEEKLSDFGIEYMDRPRKFNRHMGNGKYQVQSYKTGLDDKITNIVRNVVFEPTVPIHADWAAYTFKQVEAAFFWNKPAIISSHRVNFCGHLDEANREAGLKSLKKLLQKIVHRWPDIEFISADELGNIIAGEK